jgi:hypothetical protein
MDDMRCRMLSLVSCAHANTDDRIGPRHATATQLSVPVSHGLQQSHFRASRAHTHAGSLTCRPLDRLSAATNGRSRCWAMYDANSTVTLKLACGGRGVPEPGGGRGDFGTPRSQQEHAAAQATGAAVRLHAPLQCLHKRARVEHIGAYLLLDAVSSPRSPHSRMAHTHDTQNRGKEHSPDRVRAGVTRHDFLRTTYPRPRTTTRPRHSLRRTTTTFQ